MKLYRYSPVDSHEDLGRAIAHIHIECHKLCKSVLGEYLKVDNMIGFFSHYPEEYEQLLKLQEQLVVKDDNINGKYFRLKEPINIPKAQEVPAARYQYLYIRQPDPYRSQVGDVDFLMPTSQFEKLKSNLPAGARVFERSELDMVELYDSDTDVLAYVKSHR